MDRLTERDTEGKAKMKRRSHVLISGLEKLAAYEDTGLEPSEVQFVLEEYKRYSEADEQGRLIVRPGTVYQTDGVDIYESTVRKVIYDAGHFAFDDDAIGHSVWLSREAAEAARGGGGDG